MKGLRNRQTRINPETWTGKKDLPGKGERRLKKNLPKPETRSKKKVD